MTTLYTMFEGRRYQRAWLVITVTSVWALDPRSGNAIHLCKACLHHGRTAAASSASARFGLGTGIAWGQPY